MRSLYTPSSFVSRAICLALLSPVSLFAQDESSEKVTGLANLINATGLPFFIALSLLTIGLLAVVIYNLVLLAPKGRFIPADVYARLHELMSACQVRSAIEVAAADSSYLGRMMAEALPKIDATDPEGLGREKVEDAMADFSFRENRPYQSWLSWMSLLGQVSPMVGLLGTVMGMIGAFAELSQGNVNAADLAGDINTALYTTAWGLIIAIPSLFAFIGCKNLLNTRVNQALQAGSELVDASVVAVNAENLLAKVPEGLAN